MAVLIICVSWAVAGQAVMISIVPYMAIVNGEYILVASTVSSQMLHSVSILTQYSSQVWFLLFTH